MAATSAAQDYLAAIYRLSRGGSPARTAAIAQRLRVAGGSVSGMLRHLEGQGLVTHARGSAGLTPAGERVALQLIRRHRVLETYLVTTLRYSWDLVHEEADRLEHAVSDALIDRMADALGAPAVDPHGAPIPAPGSVFHEEQCSSLAELAVGEPVLVRRVEAAEPAMLRYLAALGIAPGVEVVVVERAPFGGPVRLRVADAEHLVGIAVTRAIRADPVAKAGGTSRTPRRGRRAERSHFRGESP
ncbi:MAG TPA: metal-dependent transcriptional regulator [Gemmatimonadaceae bacterium]|nr:metal-dependent transcriptional regulator [Gemmatimonadaceae bacterium]